MKTLAEMINLSKNKKTWDLITLSRTGLALSHLLFADDLMLFAKADTKSSTAINNVIKQFATLAAQRINHAKLKIIFSPNTPQSTHMCVSGILNMRISTKVGQYLGLPIANLQPQCRDYK